MCACVFVGKYVFIVKLNVCSNYNILPFYGENYQLKSKWNKLQVYKIRDRVSITNLKK